jgi:hypothetical protein
MNIKNIKNTHILFLLFFVFSLVLVWGFFSRKEGFEPWSDSAVQLFTEYANTANPTYVYDISYVQMTAGEDEVFSLIDNDEWPWDPDFQALWSNAAQRSPVTKYDPDSTMKVNQTIFNQGAAEQILALNTEEGRFLTRGVVLDRNTKGGHGIGIFGKTSGLDQGGDGDLLRCHPETGSMARVRRGGYDGLFSVSPDVATEVPYSYLPYLVPGFSFVDAPCNPCSVLQNDYSCRFTLGSSVSPIWSYLWGK